MSASLITSGESISGASVGGGQSLTILPGGSVSGATISGGSSSVYGSAAGSVVQAFGVEYVFTGGLSAGAVVIDARQILEQGTPPTGLLSVQGGNAPFQVFTFTSADGRSLAQALANNINAAPAADVQTFDAGGTNYTTLPYVLVNGPGSSTIVGTSSADTDYILNSAGASVFTDGNASVAAAGGNNTIALFNGSTYDVVSGAGNDLIYANGNGSVDAGAGTNTVLLGTGSNIVTSDGTADVIAAGSGAATIGEGGSGGIVFLASGTGVVADTGSGDSIIGGTGADTIFGGSQGIYFLGSSSNIFVGSTEATGSDTVIGTSGGVETMFGGTSDVVFAGSSTLNFVGAAGGSSTISAGSGEVTAFSGTGGFITFNATTAGSYAEAGAGNSTIDASPSTATVNLVASAGNAVMIGGSGNDVFFDGSGSATFTGGAGDNSYYFAKDATGGTALITDFKSGDSLILAGYGSQEVANALATATESDDVETITLEDNTRISFIGDPTLNNSNITGFAVPVSGQSSGPSGTPQNVFITDETPVLPPAPDENAPDAPLPSIATANGTAIGTTIGLGGEQDVADGSVAQNTLIDQGGVQYVSAGGFADNTTIAGGGMSLAGGAFATTDITFDGAGGSLSLAGSIFDTAPIAGFAPGDSITLSDIAFDPAGSVALNAGDTELVVTENGNVYDLAFDGANGEHFALSDAPSDAGTVITEDTLCYLRGTRILTPSGSRAIETLAIGDVVVTRFGGFQKIRWIGRQSYDARFLRRHSGRIPVRIEPGALGENLPVRTLLVSPGHSMLLGEILVLAGDLVNGTTITQSLENAPAVVDYLQIELERHDCVLAEGCWSETYADAPGMRAQFHNAAEFLALYPDEVEPAALIPLCAPRPFNARRLEGYTEVVTPTLISGWAMDEARPDAALELVVQLGDVVLGTMMSSAHRGDLAAAGKGNGEHGFTFVPDMPLDPAMLQHVRITHSGTALPRAA